MATNCSFPAGSAPSAAGLVRPSEFAPPPGKGSSLHYNCGPRSRKATLIAVTVSAGLHVGLLFGFGPAKEKVAPPEEKPLIELTLTMPDLKELEEPEPEPSEDTGPLESLGVWVPMQPDFPQIPQLGDFVQQIDFAPFIDRSNLDQQKMWSIPPEIRRGGKIGEGMGNIFNLKDLDRAPEPIFQPSPVYPNSMKTAAITATVMVEFIVDTRGQVANATAIDSTHYGFEEAAVAGVQKWKFRAGMRWGRKVNTRMQVPIVFKIVEDVP